MLAVFWVVINKRTKSLALDLCLLSWGFYAEWSGLFLLDGYLPRGSLAVELKVVGLIPGCKKKYFCAILSVHVQEPQSTKTILKPPHYGVFHRLWVALGHWISDNCSKWISWNQHLYSVHLLCLQLRSCVACGGADLKGDADLKVNLIFLIQLSLLITNLHIANSWI